MGAFVKVLVEGPGLYILVGNGAIKMKEERKGKIFHWVERALARLDLIGDKSEFNRRRKRKVRKIEQKRQK